MVIVKNSGGYYRDGVRITEKEYEHIQEMIRSRPTAPEGYAYRLTADLEWEIYELPAEEEPDLTADEALDIILGGAV